MSGTWSLGSLNKEKQLKKFIYCYKDNISYVTAVFFLQTNSIIIYFRSTCAVCLVLISNSVSFDVQHKFLLVSQQKLLLHIQSYKHNLLLKDKSISPLWVNERTNLRRLLTCPCLFGHCRYLSCFVSIPPLPIIYDQYICFRQVGDDAYILFMIVES